MLKRKIFTGILTSALAISFAVPVLAATSYSSTITLPRTGSWKTQMRKATQVKQQTKVENNAYDVNGRIVMSANGNPLSSYVTHESVGESGYGDIHSHDTGTSVGTEIKGEFKTSMVNYRTTTALITWTP